MSVILIRLVQSFLLSLSFKSMGDCRHRSPALFKVLTRGPGEPSKKSYHGAVGRPFPSVPEMTHWSSWQSVLNVIQMFPFKQILDFVTSCVACRCQLRKGLPKRNSSKNVPINHKVIHFLKPTLSQTEARRSCCCTLLILYLKLSILRSVSNPVNWKARFPAVGFKLLAVMNMMNYFNFRNFLDFIIVAAAWSLAHADRSPNPSSCGAELV